MNNFKYDVAISLCKEDVEFAKRLIKAINPSLNVFFYADRQEDLISKSGPEAFAKIFKNESRIVVVLLYYPMKNHSHDCQESQLC